MFTKYKDGAEEEVSEVYRYESGAEQEAEAVYKYEDGAEVEVWSAIDVMYVDSCTLTNGTLEVSDKKTAFNFSKYEDDAQAMGSLSGSGSIKFVIDGNWTNPTFALDWFGGLNYCDATYSKFYQGIMGTVLVGYIDASGNNTVITSIAVGGQETDSTAWCVSYGNVSEEITETVSQFYIQIMPKSLEGGYHNAGCELTIYNVSIDGELIGFTPEAEQYSTYINDYE